MQELRRAPEAEGGGLLRVLFLWRRALAENAAGETLAHTPDTGRYSERRRRWSDDEKAQAVEASLAPGAVARRRGLTPQQLFSWRRVAREKAATSDAVPFAPVVVEPREEASAASAAQSRPVAVRPHVIELDVDGASVWIWRGADIGMVTAIVDALKGRP